MALRITAVAAELIRVEADGKLTVIGLFTTNMGIPEPLSAPLISFLVIIEGDRDDSSSGLTIEIMMPGGVNPTRYFVPDILPIQVFETGTWRRVIPMQLTSVVANPGEIRCSVVYNGRRTTTTAGWIVLNQSANGSSPPS